MMPMILLGDSTQGSGCRLAGWASKKEAKSGNYGTLVAG